MYFPDPGEPSGGTRSRTPLVILAALVALLVGIGATFAVTRVLHRQGEVPSVQSAEPPQRADDSVAATEPAEVAQLDNAQLASLHGTSVFKIEADGCGAVSSGSAWVLDEHHLVTNAHVVSTDSSPTVRSRDGQLVFTGTVIGAETDPDVAVIEVEETLPAALPWAATDQLAEGQDILALGYPVPAGDFSAIPSTIISFQLNGAVREAIRTDGAVDHGNSGGPAITRDGEVAGVVTLMLIESNQLQMVPILFTADALQSTVDGIVANPELVEADCDASFGVIPDTWGADDWSPGQDVGPQTYGDDSGLDGLWDECEAGDLQACDDLYFSAGWGSEYEEFGGTCGERSDPAYGMCDIYADWEADDARAEEEEREAEAAEQALLEELSASCEAGDMQACDDLTWEAPYGSAEYDLGESCGGHYPDGWASCVDRAADAAELVDLANSCSAGDMQACDDLWWAAASGTPEYDIADNCGGYYPGEGGMCVWAEEDAP